MANYFEFVNKYKDCGLPLPQPATPGSAGLDLRAAHDAVIPPFMAKYGQYPKGGAVTIDENEKNIKDIDGRLTLVSTGLKVHLDDNYFLTIVPRSSMPYKQWLFVGNSPAVIDADYYNNPDNEGEIFVQLINMTPNPLHIKKGDKIGQALFIPYVLPENVKPENDKRLGGHGSTDKK